MPKTELIISGNSKQAVSAVDDINRSLKKLSDETLKLSDAGKLLGGVFSTAAFIGFSKSVLDAEVSMQKMMNTMKAVTGSMDQASSEMAFVRNESQRLGMSLETTTSAYAKLAASARGTSLQGAGTRKIFTGISEASTVLGLGSAETQGALLAISQMISKGTVQAEELRGQLGERLPGAFQIAARAMGKTTQELSKMLDLGQLIAADFLPKFADELHKTFGIDAEQAANSLQAQLNRLETSWFDFKLKLEQSGTFTALVSGAQDAIKVLERFVKNLQITGVITGAELDKMKARFTTGGLASAAGTIIKSWGGGLGEKLFGAYIDKNPAITDYKEQIDVINAMAGEQIAEIEKKFNIKPEDKGPGKSWAKLDPAADMKKTTDAMKQMEQYIKQYTKSLSELASEEYKIIDQKFSDEMKKQLEAFKETDTIGDIAEKMKLYSATMDTVWTRQKTALDTVYDSMSKLSREVGKEQKAVADKMRSEAEEAFLRSVETKTKQDIKLWQNYYNTLKSMHSDAVEDMKKKTKELQDIETDLRKLIAERAAFTARPETTTSYIDYMNKQEEAAKMIAGLGGLSGDALTKGIANAKEFITRNFSNAVDIFSKQDVIETGNKFLESLANLASQANIEQQAKHNEQIQTLADAMKVVDQTIESLNSNLITLNQSLAELALKQITLEATNNVSPVINQIKNDLAALGTISLSIDVQNLGKAPAFTGRQVITSQNMGSDNLAIMGNRAEGTDLNGQSFSYTLDSFGNWIPTAAAGIPYIYQDGPVYVHKGERILTEQESRNYSRAGGSLTIQGGIMISLPNAQADAQSVPAMIDAFEAELVRRWKTDRSRLKKEMNA